MAAEANHSTVTVPDLNNLAQSAAEAKLKDAGLKVGAVTHEPCRRSERPVGIGRWPGGIERAAG